MEVIRESVSIELPENVELYTIYMSINIQLSDIRVFCQIVYVYPSLKSSYDTDVP